MKDMKPEHVHCPEGCEHAMFLVSDGRRLCVECFYRGDISPAIPCTPQICPHPDRLHAQPET